MSSINDLRTASLSHIVSPKCIHLCLFMFTGHEVIRGAMIDIEAALDRDDLEEARRLWNGLLKWDNIHMKMEEGTKDQQTSPIGMFQLLNLHGEGISKQCDELREQHGHLYEFEQDIKDAFEHAKDVSEAVKTAFASFKTENLLHLEKEEKIMMPAIQKLMKAGKPMKKYMLEDIFPLIADEDLEFFIKFANEILQKHEEGGMPRVRVFDHALWAIATREQWFVWDEWIQEVLSDEKYKELQSAIADWKAHQQKQTKEPVATLQAPLTSLPAKPADSGKPEQALAPSPESGCNCIVM